MGNIDSEKARGWLRDVIYIIILIISVIMAYGMLDKRITVVETEQKYKISRQELYNKLDELKKDLLDEIKSLKNDK